MELLSFNENYLQYLKSYNVDSLIAIEGFANV